MSNEHIKLKVYPVREMGYYPNENSGMYGCNVHESYEHLVTLNTYGNIIIKGTMPKLQCCNWYDITVKQVIDKRYGLQYQFVSMDVQRPITSEQQVTFLKTLLTPHQVECVTKVYDMPVDEIINDTFDFRKVYGFGAKNYIPIRQKILDNFVLFELLSKFGKYGITYKQSIQIYKEFGSSESAVVHVERNPYVLYQRIKGMSFRKVDEIALKMGVAEDDPRRIHAGVQYTLEENEERGNTWMYLKELSRRLLKNVDIHIALDKILEVIKPEIQCFYIDESRIGMAYAHETEVNIAKELERISKNIVNIDFDVESFVKEQECIQGINYNELQCKLFYETTNSNVVIFTGSAGTGKSKSLEGLGNMCDKLEWDISQFALSGIASEVIQSYTNRPASTIHSGLGWTIEGFTYNSGNKLKGKVFVLDESSMVNIYLFYDLIQAIPDGGKLILVGDIAQLEAIGAGAFLQDMIKSNVFPHIHLTEVYRQALDSGILDLATKVRNGEKFIPDDASGIYSFGINKDAHIMITENGNTVDTILKVYKSLLSKNSVSDIIVIVPKKSVECGSKNLNNLIQAIANPPSIDKKEIKLIRDYNDFYIRTGDRVINTKNNYKAVWLNKYLQPQIILDEDQDRNLNKNVIYNGERGYVLHIQDSQDGTVVSNDYGKKIISYSYDELNSVDLSYCRTCHSLQGSNSPIVIFGLDSSHYNMSTRSLLYTAITRTKSTLIICCDPKTLNYAIDNNPIIFKKTFLYELLIGIDSSIIVTSNKEAINFDDYEFEFNECEE